MATGRSAAKIVIKRNAPARAAAAPTSPTGERKAAPSALVVFNGTASLGPEVLLAEGQAPPPGALCSRCRRTIGTKDGCGPGGQWLGLTERVVYHADGRREHLTTEYCGTFPCAYALIRALMHVPRRYAEAQRKEVQLKALFERQYPGKTLRPSPEPQLLATHGGPLSAREYDSEGFIYTPLPSVEMIPTTRSFLRTIRS